nr:hypothetical protein [Tanacetum cinerariifolium]
MESLNSNSQERELHQLQKMHDNAKESCMTSFQQLHSFLQVLSYDESKSRRVSERAFMTFFGQDNETFTINESSGIDTGKQDTSSTSGNHITHVVDADIRPANDQVSFVEIPTGKLFDSCTSKVNSEPPNGSNEDITNPYERYQTLKVSANTLKCMYIFQSQKGKTWSLGTKRTDISETKGSRNSYMMYMFNDVCSHQFRPRSSTTRWRLLTTLQALLLKEKKGVRFSALYLKKKRYLLVFDHSRLHYLYVPMLIQPLNPAAVVAPRAVDPAGSPSSTTIDQDVPSAKVTEKQARNVQTSLTLSSAKLEIQSLVDVPIHQEDPTIQRTPLIDTIISMVTDKTTSTPTPSTTQAHVQICLTSYWFQEEFRSAGWCKENSDGQKTVAEDGMTHS